MSKGRGLIWVVAVWLFLLPAGPRFLRDPGTAWHSAVGSRMLLNGEVMRVDPYTCSRAGERWVAQQWLAEVVMAWLDEFDGLDALLIAATAIVAAAYGGLAARIHAAGWHVALVGVILAFGLAASATHFHARPMLATIAGQALTVVVLADVEAGRRRPGWLFVLVPVFWLWGQSHGGVLGGIATVGLWATLRLAGGTFGGAWGVAAGRPATIGTPGQPPVSESRCPDVPMVAAAGATVSQVVLFVLVALAAVQLLGPLGPDLPRAWYDVLRIGELPDVIREHAPARFDEAEGWSLVAAGAGYLVALGSVPWRRWRASWLLPIVWLALGLMRVRNAPLFAVTALAVMPDLLGQSRWVGRLAARDSDIYTPAPIAAWRPGLAWLAFPALVALALVGWKNQGHADGRRWLDPEAFPVEVDEALRLLERQNRDGLDVFCEYTYGGYLIRYHPALHPIIDDRCELFGGSFLREFVAAENDAALAEQYVRDAVGRYRIGAAVVKAGGTFDQAFGGIPGWERAGDSPTARVYRRRP